jgi:hypothetical protein
VWLSGLGLISIGGFGEILYGDVNEITRSGFTSASAVLIAVGCLIAIVGFAGCYGSIRESYSTLKFFSYALVLLVIVEISLGAWLYFSHVRVFIVLQGFLSQIISKYEIDNDVEKLIDKVQEKYKCCGAKQNSDWYNSDRNKNRQNTSLDTWINNVPHSCCLSNTTHSQTCGDDLDTETRPAYMYVHKQGCFEYIRGYLLHHIGIVVSVGAVVVTLQVTAMLLACCLRRAIKVALQREFGNHVNVVL